MERILPSLELTLNIGRLPDFFQLFQVGINVRIQTGISLEELFSQQWGIDPDYVENRITTIFVNHRAIDKISEAIIHNGSTVALSGAMPGLVGATMRRGGFYAAMRDNMTYHDETKDENNMEGVITLKLFNLILPELTPSFLKRGILLSAESLECFINGEDDNFRNDCRVVKRNGLLCREMDLNRFCQKCGNNRIIELKVQFSE